MRMTDAEAFDFLTPKDGPTIEQEAAIEHLRARLAADQQKGGGEVACHRWLRNGEPAAYGWTHGEPSEAQIQAQRRCNQRCGGNDLWQIEYAYKDPQPSIPAPAQQEVERAQINLDAGWYARREAEARAMGYAGVADALDDLSERLEASRAQQDGKASGVAWRIVGVVTNGGIVWNDMPEPKTYLYAKNAPHADQETQG